MFFEEFEYKRNENIVNTCFTPTFIFYFSNGEFVCPCYSPNKILFFLLSPPSFYSLLLFSYSNNRRLSFLFLFSFLFIVSICTVLGGLVEASTYTSSYGPPNWAHFGSKISELIQWLVCSHLKNKKVKNEWFIGYKKCSARC